MSLIRSFIWAAKGIIHCFRHERNFRIHVIIALYVLSLAPRFFTTTIEWAVLFLTVFLMLAAEAINTALENLTDLASPTKNPLARVVKDVAAGAVLLSSICAVLVGIALFWKPQVWYNLFEEFKSNFFLPIIFIISVGVSCFVIFSIKQEKNNGIEAEEKDETTK